MHHPGLINKRALKIADENSRENGVPIQDNVDQADFESATEMKACYMLSGSKNVRYGKLTDYLKNRYAITKADKYPRSTTILLSRMNKFYVAPKRHNSNNNNNNNVRPPRIDGGVNFAQEGEKEKEEVQEGATFIQHRTATPHLPAQQQKKQVAWVGRQGNCAQKVATKPPNDKVKEHAKQDRQVAPKDAKPPSGFHCGGGPYPSGMPRSY